MSNMVLTRSNLADDGTLSDPDSEWTARSLNNLQTTLLSETARTGQISPLKTKFDLDLGKKGSINLISLWNHNLTTDGTWQVLIAKDSGFTNIVYDSGEIAIWRRTQGFGSEPYGEFVWNGRENTDEGNFGLLWIPSAPLGRYVRVILDDDSNGNSDGYIEAGRFYIDVAWQPSFNMKPGVSLKWVDRSNKRRTRGGAPWVAKLEPYREVRVPLGFLPEDEIYNQVYEISKRRGLGEQIVFIYDPENTAQLHRQAFIGTLQQMPAINRTNAIDLHATELVIAESRG